MSEYAELQARYPPRRRQQSELAEDTALERTHHLANLGLDLLQVLLGRRIHPDMRTDRPERERKVRLGQVLDLAPPQRVFAERDEAEVQVLLRRKSENPGSAHLFSPIAGGKPDRAGVEEGAEDSARLTLAKTSRPFSTAAATFKRSSVRKALAYSAYGAERTLIACETACEV